jgi:TatD DNase family protein
MWLGLKRGRFTLSKNQSPKPMKLRLYDAHNHLQDARLAAQCESIMADTRETGVVKMVVNGSSEEDWKDVQELGSRYPEVIPSFGCHPWYVKERSPGWRQALERCLDAVPSAVGEAGLDRWIKNYDLAAQEEVFVWQLRLAAVRNLPLSIHCLQAWGRLLEILEAEPRPKCGLLLHSYGGPRELVPPLAELGAYFSLSGYFAHKRKARQREAFRSVPAERLLIETDAPDQLLPAEREDYTLKEEAAGKPINHPANLGAIYRFAAELRGEPLEDLARQVEQNFFRLFGRILQAPTPHDHSASRQGSG